jgi:hypothetical protein
MFRTTLTFQEDLPLFLFDHQLGCQPLSTTTSNAYQSTLVTYPILTQTTTTTQNYESSYSTNQSKAPLPCRNKRWHFTCQHWKMLLRKAF